MATPALDLQQLRKRAHLSYSQIQSYLSCPRQYHYRYVQHIKSLHRNSGQVFGKALHQTLEWFYINHEKPAVADLHENFGFSWQQQLNQPTPIRFPETESPESLLKTGMALLTAFKEDAPVYPEIIEVEQPFSFEVIDFKTGEVLPPLIGAFDLVVRDDAGHIIVIDHKVVKSRWSEGQLAQSLQLSTYHYAAELLGYGNVGLGVQLFLKQKTPKFAALYTSRTASAHQDIIQTAIGVTRAIDAGVNYPVRSWMCDGCAYKEQCDNERSIP